MTRRYFMMCRTSMEPGNYLLVRVYIDADTPFTARKLLESQYGQRLVGNVMQA